MNIKKKNKTHSSAVRTNDNNSGLLVDKDMSDEMFSGGIVLDLPKIFKYKP